MSMPRNTCGDERDRVEQIILLVRIHLYNAGQACNAVAVRRYLIEREALRPVPSASKIGAVLREYGLTHGRLGWDDGVEPRRLFDFTTKPKKGVTFWRAAPPPRGGGRLAG